MVKTGVYDFRKVLQAVSNDSGHALMDVFKAAVKCWACAFSLGAREAEYMAEIGRWSKPHARAFATALGHLTAQMEERRAKSGWDDLLGETFEAELSGGRAAQMGQFFTPMDVCRVMAEATIDVEVFRQGRVIEVYEPTCGSGRNVLAFWEAMEKRGLLPFSARATCWDLDPVAADMTVVNLALHGIPGVVVHGNTLTQEAFKTTFSPFWNAATPAAAATSFGIPGLLEAIAELEAKDAPPRKQDEAGAADRPVPANQSGIRANSAGARASQNAPQPADVILPTGQFAIDFGEAA